MVTNVRWRVVGLLFLGGLISYLDRAALSVAAPFLTKDLGLDPAHLGVVFSSFFFGYALFCFVGGWCADRFGPKLVFVVSMTVWSVFCGLTAVATTVGALLVIRVIFGMGEGPFSTAANKMVGNWFPHANQATAVGLANAGTPLGGALAGPVVGYIALSYGWRVSFVVIAAIGFVWVVVWALSVTDTPATHPRASAGERGLVEGGRPPVSAAALPGEAVPLGEILMRPAILATAFAFFGYAYILYFFLSWFPTYLTSARGLSVQSMSLVTTIPWLLGFVGLAGGGFVADRLYRATGNAVLSRKLLLVTSLLAAAACVALAGTVSTVEAAVALMAVSVFFMYLTGNTYWAIILDTVPQARVGGVGGFVHLIANLAGIVAPSITGFMVQATGGFSGAFLLAGAFAVVGALAVAVLVRTPATVPVRLGVPG
jgi:MFS transporter, ACS family, hexuronate transporter